MNFNKNDNVEDVNLKEYNFSDAIDIGPTRSLSKGDSAKHVAMKDLKGFTKKITNFEIKEYKGGSKFKNDDILMARITPCLENGKTAFVDILDEGEIAFGSTEFIVFSAKEDITIPHYVFYLITSPYIRRLAIKSMTGTSGRQRVDKRIFNQIKIKLPPIEEQKRIVKILKAFDDKIELNHHINGILEKIAHAIFKSWFIDYEGFQDIEFKESQLGSIPNGWRIGVLKEILSSLESGKRPKGGVGDLNEGIPSIGAENILGLGKYDYTKEKFISKEFYKKMTKGRVKSGDVLLYKDGANLGRKSLFMDGFPHRTCCINEHVFILRVNEILPSPIYLFFWLDQERITQEIINLNSGGAQPGINMKSVYSIKILIPDIETIENFNSLIEPFIKKIMLNGNENKKLRKLRDLLLPQLISGRLRINNPKDFLEEIKN